MFQTSGGIVMSPGFRWYCYVTRLQVVLFCHQTSGGIAMSPDFRWYCYVTRLQVVLLCHQTSGGIVMLQAFAQTGPHHSAAVPRGAAPHEHCGLCSSGAARLGAAPVCGPLELRPARVRPTCSHHLSLAGQAGRSACARSVSRPVQFF